MRRRDKVTCFLQHEGQILVLRRSQKVRTHRGKWAGVSGGIDAVTPLQQALQEMREETGLGENEVWLLRQGEPLKVPDAENNVEWRVHPFLFAVQEPDRIRLDWEHTESRWIAPGDLVKLDTVPGLKEMWERLWTT